jgi:serine O-acetyltransferase
VVDALCQMTEPVRRLKRTPRDQPLPSRDAVIEAVEMLRGVMFPGYFGTSELTAATIRFYVGSTLDRALRILMEQVRRGICFSREHHQRCLDCVTRSEEAIRRFAQGLPEVRRLLAADAEAAYEGDPAATDPDEAIFCYPGLQAIMSYRIAHLFHLEGIPLLPRIITEHAHSITGIDIHPGARVGESFFIDHGTGVVIGETTVIGNHVRIYQGVTLGARSFPLDESGRPVKGVARHPIVEDEVIIYSGATILGRVTLGRGAVIGGNVWVTRDVPPGSVITQARAREDAFEDGAGI